MINRRKFIFRSSMALAGAALLRKPVISANSFNGSDGGPVVISTWNHGIEANEEAWKVISAGGRALDAVEKGVMVTEADPNNHSVGIGGYPDRDGHVTLDACIMDEKGNCGSVCFLENILHPISVARLVMEKTPHVMLSGEGALQFARENGFPEVNLLTPEMEKAWKEWLKEARYQPVINIENHDTIGMLAIDKQGNMAGACTTSGMGYKMHGRVGDSPIIGAGLFLDNEVGGAVATGNGELVMRTLGSFLVVELMRNGLTPEEAVIEAVTRIIKQNSDLSNMQVGYLALRKDGSFAAYSIHKGFNYAVYQDGQNRLVDSEYFMG